VFIVGCRENILEERKMKHKDTGWRCLVAHYDESGIIEEGCIYCSCGKYIRPNDWKEHLKKESTTLVGKLHR